jgi:hypothetical protein
MGRIPRGLGHTAASEAGQRQNGPHWHGRPVLALPSSGACSVPTARCDCALRGAASAALYEERRHWWCGGWCGGRRMRCPTSATRVGCWWLRGCRGRRRGGSALGRRPVASALTHNNGMGGGSGGVYGHHGGSRLRHWEREWNAPSAA